MIDRPSSIDLLTAMATTLSDQVVPACGGAPQHAARVVANLCRILARESELGAAHAATSVSELRTFLDTDSGDLAELVTKLDAMLADPAPPAGPELHSMLLQNVEGRLAVAKPSYRSGPTHR